MTIIQLKVFWVYRDWAVKFQCFVILEKINPGTSKESNYTWLTCKKGNSFDNRNITPWNSRQKTVLLWSCSTNIRTAKRNNSSINSLVRWENIYSDIFMVLFFSTISNFSLWSKVSKKKGCWIIVRSETVNGSRKVHW